MIARYSVPAAWAEVTERMYLAADALFVKRGALGTFGPQLPAALAAAGLDDVSAKIHAPLVSGGTSGDWVRLTVDQLRTGFVSTGYVTAVEVDDWLEFSTDPHMRYLPPFMLTAWARRPR